MSCTSRSIDRAIVISTLLPVALASVAGAQGLSSRTYFRQETELQAGYDSNIYGSGNDETSDGFATLSHAMTYGRTQNSLTQLDLTGDIQGTWFFSESDANSLDGGLRLDAAYPRDHEDISYWEGEAFWRSETAVERTLQDRIRRERYGLGLLGEWYASPKLIVSGGAGALVVDRSNADYPINRRTHLNLGVGHFWIPERRWFLDYTLEFGESDPTGPIQSTDSVSHEIGLRVRGRVLPKVTGNAFVGYQHSDFSGRQDFSDGGVSWAADVKWDASALTSVQLKTRRSTEFSPSGFATRRDMFTLLAEHAIGPAYRATFEVSPDVIRYEREDRKDEILNLRAALRYRRTDRFFAEAEVTWGTIDSNLPERDADQTVFTLSCGLAY